MSHDLGVPPTSPNNVCKFPFEMGFYLLLGTRRTESMCIKHGHQLEYKFPFLEMFFVGGSQHESNMCFECITCLFKIDNDL